MDEKHFDIYEEQSTILLEKLERLDNSDFPADILKEKISEFLNPSYSFMSEEKRLELLNIYQ
jgi:hypothetical protein